MTLLFRRHVPNFASGIEHIEVEFINLEQMKELDHIKSLMTMPGFVELTKSELRVPFDDRGDFLISAFFEDSHWVIGYIRADNAIDLELLSVVHQGMELRDWEQAKADLDARREKRN